MTDIPTELQPRVVALLRGMATNRDMTIRERYAEARAIVAELPEPVDPPCGVCNLDTAGLHKLKAERDALNERIALIEEGVRKAAYDTSMREQLIRVNDSRKAVDKRQITMAEFCSGILMDEDKP